MPVLAEIVVHAVIPETMPSLISWTLYAAENNIRSATVVGMLPGGGIGYLMSIYQGGLYIGYTGISGMGILHSVYYNHGDYHGSNICTD